MYKLKTHLYLLVIANFLACQFSNKSEQVKTSYKVIHNSVLRIYKDGDIFFIEAGRLLHEARSYRDSIIDTKEFEKILDQVRYNSESEFTALNLSREPDIKINYKQKALKVWNMLNDIYRTELEQFVSAFNSKSQAKIDACYDLLKDKIAKIEQAMIECDNAGKALREKYNID